LDQSARLGLEFFSDSETQFICFYEFQPWLCPRARTIVHNPIEEMAAESEVEENSEKAALNQAEIEVVN
jgi:hypothetical protein